MEKNVNNSIDIAVIPRFTGVAKKSITEMDFLIELTPPPKLGNWNKRPPLNVGIAIDKSGSMTETALQEPGTTVPGRWEQRMIRPVPWFLSPGQWTPNIEINTTFGHAQQGKPEGMPLSPPMPGYEWAFIPEMVIPGKRHTKMDYAIKAAHEAIDQLTERDRISVVAFNGQVHLVYPSQPATEQNKAACKLAVSALRPEGGTALHAGWKAAAEQVCTSMTKNSVNRVLLLTDGQPSDNMRDPAVLKAHTAGLAQHGVTTSTFGVGLSFSEDLLQAMAEGGDGRYYYLDNPVTMGERFSEEFSGLSQLYGRNVKLTANLGPGLELVECLNALEHSNNVFTLGNLVRGHTQQIVLRCKVDANTNSPLSFGVSCSWADTEGKKLDANSSCVLSALSNKAKTALNENTRVGERVAELEIAKAQRAAIEALDRGNVELSRTILNDTMVGASTSCYASAVGQVGKLAAFTAMANSDNHLGLRKSVAYDMYETSNSRKS